MTPVTRLADVASLQVHVSSPKRKADRDLVAFTCHEEIELQTSRTSAPPETVRVRFAFGSF